MLFQVCKLFYHLPNERYIVFSEGKQEVGLAQGEQLTTLTAWILANSEDPNDPVDKFRRTNIWQGASPTTVSLLSSPTTSPAGTRLEGSRDTGLTLAGFPFVP